MLFLIFFFNRLVDDMLFFLDKFAHRHYTISRLISYLFVNTKKYLNFTKNSKH
jgi:hypothetical protein